MAITTPERPLNCSITRVETSRTVPGMEEDVRSGLTGSLKRLSPKYFYDERGSELFDLICDTPEYYLTRTEFGLLERYAGDVIRLCRPQHLLELGSGTSRKTRILLDHWKQYSGKHTYWPFDVSAEMLETVAHDLAQEYPGLHIHGLIGDYSAGLRRLPEMKGTTLALFLGSTLGNFRPHQARHFLEEVIACLEPGDYFLLGADLDKDPAMLTAAYNDAAGVTEAFNRNVLVVINRELDADFDPTLFAHRAIYNAEKRRMEMHLDALEDLTVHIGALDLEVPFRAGESIWTEISRKFTIGELDALFDDVGLEVSERYIDPTHPYALVLGRLRAR